MHTPALAAIVLGTLIAMPAHAAAPGSETVSVRVAHAPAAPRHEMERRIAVAAMAACGASGFSAPGVKEAVGRSACWHDSYADGIAQLERQPARDVAALPPASTQGKP